MSISLRVSSPRAVVGCLLGPLLVFGGCHPAPHAPTPSPVVIRAQPLRPGIDRDPVIDPDAMLRDLDWLARDELAGRYSLDDTIRQAAAYIAERHAEMGLAPIGDAYLVDYDLPAGSRPGRAYHVWIETPSGNVEVPISAQAALSLGEAPAVARAAWLRVDERTPLRLDAKQVDGRIVVLESTGTPEARRSQIAALADAGARGVVAVVPSEELSSVGEAAEGFDALAIDQRHLEHLRPAKLRPGKVVRLDDVRISMARVKEEITKPAPNVLAVLPGTTRSDEIVLLGAHYDHVGTMSEGFFCRHPDREDDPDDEICNGADDNASGSAMVLAVARALKQVEYRPARTLVFAHFSGEELGLHGSAALAQRPPDLPPFRGGKVVAMVNLDMVGRLSEEGLEISGLGSSPQWRAILDKVGTSDLSVRFVDTVTPRSDHASFYRQQIPVLFFFTGLHDDYHRTSDESDAINREGMAKIASVVLRVVRELGDGAEVPFTPIRG